MAAHNRHVKSAISPTGGKPGRAPARAGTLVDRVRTRVEPLVQWWKNSRAARALKRYQVQQGRLLAGGIAYMALFSIAAALTLGWTVFARIFAEDSAFRAAVAGAVDRILPGVLADPSNGTAGLLDVRELELGSPNTVVGIGAFVVALWSATRIVRYVVDGIRAMFGLDAHQLGFVRGNILYLLGLALLTVAVGATAALSVASGLLVHWLGSISPAFARFADSLTFDVASLVIPLVVNFVTFGVFVRFVASVQVDARSLAIGSAGFAVAGAVLSQASRLTIGLSSNPFITAAASAGTLLVWINLVARACLLDAAWMANPPEDEGSD